MNKNYLSGFLISVFAVLSLVFGAFHNDASAGFWDWLKLNDDSEQIQQVQQVQQTQQEATVANAEAESTLTINKSGSGSGTVSVKTSSGLLLKSCDFSSTSSCEYSPSDSNAVFLYLSFNSGSSFGGITGCTAGSNLSKSYTSGHCGVLMDSDSTVTVTFNSGSGGSTISSSSSSSSSSSLPLSSYPTNLTVKTNDATKITSNSATLNGEVDPKGEVIIYRFLHVKTGQPETAKSSPWKRMSDISNKIPVSLDISSLSSETSYNFTFQIYSFTSKGARQGEIKTFKTSKGSINSSSSSTSSPTSGGSSSSFSSSSSKSYQLTVKKTGYGSIKSSQQDIDGNIIKCGSSCSGQFYENKKITLKAYPDENRKFVGWSGSKCASGGGAETTCQVEMDSNKKVMAEFETGEDDDTNEQPLLVTLSGDGSGRVKDSNGEIDCGNDCVGKYHTQTITLEAYPNSGSEFGGWGGACDGNSKTCEVLMDEKNTEAQKITARFNEAEGKYYDLTVTVSEGGKVISTDNKINCSSVNSPCENSYGKNGTVTFTITPDSGYLLSSTGSTGGCTESKSKNSNGSYTCKIKMTKNQKLAVNFKTSESSSSSIISSSSSRSSSTSSRSSSSYATNLTVKTNDATKITSNSATLNGTINPKGEIIAYRFLYIQADKRGTAKSTPWKTLRTGTSSDTSVFADASSLSSKTVYKFALQVYSYKSKKFSPLGGVRHFTTSSESSSSYSSSRSSSSSSSQTTASTYNLKVKVSGNGRVLDNYSQINCGSNTVCEAKYSNGKIITLLTEDRDSNGVSYNTKIESWSGGGCSGGGSTNACTVTMDGDKEITIKFVSK